MSGSWTPTTRGGSRLRPASRRASLAALAALAVLLPILLTVRSGDLSSGHWFLDLWMTPDQQGRHYFEKGDYKTAAGRFKDPMWKGVALYRAADYQGALNAFALSGTAQSYYDQGNALAQLGKYPEAVKSYEEALKGRPGWKEARDNLALVTSLIPPPPKKDTTPQGDIPPTFKPDQVQFDDTKGKKGKVQVPKWDEKQMADVWLRTIQTTPADFLRQKFAIQAREGAPPAGGAAR